MSVQNSGLPSTIQDVYQSLISMGLNLRVTNDNVLMVQPGSKITDWAEKTIKNNKPGLLGLIKGEHVNDFQESLEKGDNSQCYLFLEKVYKKAFYNLDVIARSKSGDTPAQKAGVDVKLCLTNDRTIRLDEKIRYSDYGDIILEYVSNDRRSTPGWIEKDLGIDYLNYIVWPARQAYLFPWQQLKTVWVKNKSNWMKCAEQRKNGFSIVRANNNSYITLSCAVPKNLLIKEVQGAMVITI